MNEQARNPRPQPADPDKTSEQGGGRLSRLVLLACLASAGYMVLFAAIDVVLEAHVATTQQMLVRVVLVSMALLGALAVLVTVLQRERSAAAAADRCVEKARFEGALLALRELGIKSPGAAAGPVSMPPPGFSTNTLANCPEVAVLTAREREVALLIAQGRTSREIAEQLVITERTADTHADRIRAKLGVRSRTAIAAWVLGNGLLSGSGH